MRRFILLLILTGTLAVTLSSNLLGWFVGKQVDLSTSSESTTNAWRIDFDVTLKGSKVDLVDLTHRLTAIEQLLNHAEGILAAYHTRDFFDTIVAIDASRGRSYRHYLDLALTIPSGFTVEDYEQVLGHTQLAPIIDEAVAVEKELGINSLYILAHAAEESKWGTSLLVRNKNNYFGFNAIDANPNLATKFDSPSACVRKVMSYIKTHYLTEGGKYYSKKYGASLRGMNLRYASNPKWADHVARIMYQLHYAINK